MAGEQGRATRLTVGAVVEVVNRFERTWCRGFAVASVERAGYRIRRLSDGSVLPVVFDAADVR